MNAITRSLMSMPTRVRLSIYRIFKLTTNKPLIWAVVAGFLTVFITLLISGLRGSLGILPLSLQEWLWVFGVALTLLGIVEIGKVFSNRLQPED